MNKYCYIVYICIISMNTFVPVLSHLESFSFLEALTRKCYSMDARISALTAQGSRMEQKIDAIYNAIVVKEMAMTVEIKKASTVEKALEKIKELKDDLTLYQRWVSD